MKVVLGIDSWYPQVDGVTNVVVSYKKELEKEDVCKIVAPTYGKKSDAAGEESYCADVYHNYSLKAPAGGFRNSLPQSDKGLKKLLDEMRPDVLHAHSPFAILKYFKKYGKKHNIPVIYTFHTKFKEDTLRVTRSHLITSTVMSVIMRNIKKADYVWAVSEYAASILKSYGYKGEITVVPNATDIERLTRERRAQLAQTINEKWSLSPDEKILLYAGRVVKVKNLKFSFKVIAELKRRNFACKFFVVGDGEMRHHKKLAKKFGVDDMVVFTGHVLSREEISAYYARANLFLMASTFDTYGLVVAEAAACGTPSLTAEHSSYGEIITDGETGYLEPLDEKKWADRIEKVFSSGKHEEVSRNCPQAAISWQRRMEEVKELYKDTVEDFKAKQGSKAKKVQRK